MSKRARFSIVIEDPKKIEIGSAIKFDEKMIIVSKITKVEFVTSKLILVSGIGTI